jgi:hypothetical protein
VNDELPLPRPRTRPSRSPSTTTRRYRIPALCPVPRLDLFRFLPLPLFLPLFLTLFLTLSLALPLALPSPAAARIPTRVKYEDVTRVLKHRVDPTLEDLRSAGSRVDDVLVDLVGDPHIDLDIRIRASRGLGRFPGQKAKSALTTCVFSTIDPPALRGAAMLGLARIVGPSVIDDLKPFLSDRAAAVRAGAGRAIGSVRTDRARVILEGALEHEESLEVRGAIEAALKGEEIPSRPGEL